MLPIPAPKPQPPNSDAVAVLKQAKAILWDGNPDDFTDQGPKQKYICLAIGKVTRWPKETPALALAEGLIAHVEGCLYLPDSGSLCSYEGWLECHPDQPEYRYDSPQVQQARHRFINQLIADFGGNALDSYMVLYRVKAIQCPYDAPFGFQCWAEDPDHAEEQCINAYPDADVVWVGTGDSNSYPDAVSTYWTCHEDD